MVVGLGTERWVVWGVRGPVVVEVLEPVTQVVLPSFLTVPVTTPLYPSTILLDLPLHPTILHNPQYEGYNIPRNFRCSICFVNLDLVETFEPVPRYADTRSERSRHRTPHRYGVGPPTCLRGLNHTTPYTRNGRVSPQVRNTCPEVARGMNTCRDTNYGPQYPILGERRRIVGSLGRNFWKSD